MKRIKKIEVNHFKGLYGEHAIDLTNSGKNLMLYGENGSGKSSIAKAIKLFFQSSVKEINVVDFEKWFELLNPNLTAVVASTFYDDMPAIDVYNPMYIEWLGELVNKYREQCFLLKDKY